MTAPHVSTFQARLRPDDDLEVRHALGTVYTGASTAQSTATPVQAWILDNSYGLVAPTTAIPPIRAPRVNLLDGLFVEEPTSNLFLNPNMQGTVGQAPVNWTNCVVDATRAHSGSTSAKINSINAYSDPVTIFTGTTYTVSIWFYSTYAPGTIVFAGYGLGTTLTTPEGFIQNKWQRWSVTFTGSSSTAGQQRLYVQPALAVNTSWMSDAQLEISPYATSYADGGLGGGYTWDSSNNVLPNSSFESGTASWTAGQASVSSSSTYAHSGTQSLTTTYTKANQDVATYGTFTITNSTWTPSVWLLNPTSGGISPTAPITVNVGDAYGQSSGSTNTFTLPADGAWHRYVLNPATYSGMTHTNNGVFQITNGTSGPTSGTIYIDDAQMENRGYPTPYNSTPALAPSTTSSRQQGQLQWSSPYPVPQTVSLFVRASEKMVSASGNTLDTVITYPFYPGGFQMDVCGPSSTFANSIIYSLFQSVSGGNNIVALRTPLVLGDLIFIAFSMTSTNVTVTVYQNGVLCGTATGTFTGAPTYPPGPQPLQISDESAVEQLLVHAAALSQAQIAQLVLGAVDISDDPLIVFAAASRSTSGTTNSQSTTANPITVYRGRTTSFNTYGPVEPAPLQADTSTPASSLLYPTGSSGALYRVTAQRGSGVGVGDKIGFAQTPPDHVYQVVGIQTAPGQFESLYLTRLL